MSEIGDAVHAWLSEQPVWQQDLARRLATRPVLSESEMIEWLPLMAGNERDGLRPLPCDDIPGAVNSSRRILVNYGNLRRVGLVEPDQVLRFNRSLTVVYGDNAAGKSSYSRGLKLLSRSVTNDVEILGDVYGAAPSTGDDVGPSANIETADGGETTAQRVKLIASNRAWLPEMVAFDAACAEEMVNSRNQLQYVPEPLRLLARVAATQDSLRNLLVRQIAEHRATCPSMGEISENSAAGRAIASLVGTYNDPDLREVAAWDATAQARHSELTRLLAEAASSTALEDAAAATAQVEAAAALGGRIQTISDLCVAAQAEKLRAAVAAQRDADDAFAIATAAAGDLPDHLDSQPWKLLWQAARSFAADRSRPFPPAAGEPCPLCEQPLASTAADRLGHFETHVRGELSRASEAASAQLHQVLEEVAPTQVEACRTPLLTTLLETVPELGAELTSALNGLAAHLGRLVTSPVDAQAADSTLLEATQAGLAALETWATARKEHAAGLLASRDEASLGGLQTELSELTARRHLAMRLDEFTTWQASLTTIAALERQRSALATNRITTAIRTLGEAHSSAALRSKLEVETAELRCQQLPVSLDWHTAVGASTVQLVLDGSQHARISQIASDGERRALALAFFLAEAGVSDPSIVVLDDPVSSLDLERREVIVDRLVAEAQKRQVIVFSHDLPFVVDMLSRAEAAAVTVTTQTVWRVGASSVGRVQNDLPFRGMTLKQRIGVLKERLAQWDTQGAPATVDEAWRRVEGFYADLRLAWERAVEERVFKGVLLRHERAVHSQKLKKVKITDEIVDQVDHGMSRAGYFVHDAPRTSGVQLPGRSHLAKDLESLEAFSREVKPD
jgi:energy-coupling factor transporter ATP-binding protein EcfA2